MKQKIFNTLTLFVAVLSLLVGLVAISTASPEAIAQSITRFPGNIIVRGLGIFEGDVTIADDLTVADDTTVTGDLTVSGTFSPAGTFDLDGAVMAIDADADTTLQAAGDDLALLTTGAATGTFNVLVGNLLVGNGTPGVTANGEDAYIEGTLEVDGVATLDGGADLNGTTVIVDADADTTIVASFDDVISTTLGAATGRLNILTGNLKVGNGTNAVTLDGEDFYVEGTSEFDGGGQFDGAMQFNSTISQATNSANFGLMSVITTAFTYTAAAGGTGTVVTIPDGQTWLIHKVFVQTTTNFDCTGDDCTLTIGDDLDVDGFLAAADASMQAAFTEATGFEPGFYGIENGSGGAYTTDDGGPFVYLQSGAAQTIDWILAAAGNDFAAGAGTIYVLYTRVQ